MFFIRKSLSFKPNVVVWRCETAVKPEIFDYFHTLTRIINNFIQQKIELLVIYLYEDIL